MDFINRLISKSNIKVISIHPKGQDRIGNFSWLFATLFFFAVIFFCLTIYNVVKDNIKEDSTYYKFFSLTIIDTKTCCSTLLTLIGLLLVRHHFVLGFRPIIAYERLISKASSHPNFSNCNVWQVKIKNVGLGPAVFSQFQFRAQKQGLSSSEYFMDFTETEHWLQQNGFVPEKDFSLWTISKGATLPSKDQLVIFELKLTNQTRLDQLDLLVTFKGVVGGAYQKELYLIPRLGIPNFS